MSSSRSWSTAGCGFEQTTATGTARAVGVTERTFFRHCADKREALVHGQQAFERAFLDGLESAPADPRPMQLIAAALRSAASLFTDERRPYSRLSQTVIDANPALQEPERRKLAGLATSLAAALRNRGADGLSAALAAESGLVVVLPILFAAGMCLMDTIDGVFMNAAYGWAFAKPVRKVFYNITITSTSVAVALIIGTVELIGVLADQAGITSGPLAAIADIPLDYAGYAIVGLFVLAWAVAIAVWRFGRIEERWTARMGPGRG
jgi:AcrR family transcriptional regulator